MTKIKQKKSQVRKQTKKQTTKPTRPRKNVVKKEDVFFDCGHCGGSLVAEAANAGDTIICPKCTCRLVIPPTADIVYRDLIYYAKLAKKFILTRNQSLLVYLDHIELRLFKKGLYLEDGKYNKTD